jgi:hypothetical protein
MKTLRYGDTHEDVLALREALRRVGFPLSAAWRDSFDASLECVVVAYQYDAGLVPDGIVGPKTWASLQAATREDPTDHHGDTGDWDRDMPGLWRLGRMAPEYRQSRIAAWVTMEREDDPEKDYIIPFASGVPGCHGATCGHAAWLLSSWWAGAHRPERGEPITWRTGRGPTSTMPDRCVWRAPLAGVEYGGALHRGLRDLVLEQAVAGDLRTLNEEAPLHPWWVCQKQSGHIVCVVRSIPGVWVPTDPRTGLSMRAGAYRLAADGSKATTGQPWTFRRMGVLQEKGPWTCYAIGRLPPDERGAGRLRLEA